MGKNVKPIAAKTDERKKIDGALLPQVNRTKITKHQARAENAKRLRSKNKEKRARSKKRKDEGAAPLIPKTIESCREPDSTVLPDRVADDVVEEIHRDIETDEFGSYYAKEYEPKVMITFSEHPIKASRRFASQLCKVIPNCMRIGRKGSSIKLLVKEAIKRQFTDVIVINEDRFEPNGLLLIHLPEGPTAFFRLSNVKCCNKKQLKEMSRHRPEVIVNNFKTRLGMTVSRMLAALFHYHPEFRGRRAVTFHNQRDYIFFRHHRYKFLKGHPSLRELGPRFTLKLESLQHGTFDSKCGEYEWTMFGRRHELETSRRKFFL